MSQNRGRRITINGKQARDLTRSELYDAMALLIVSAPLEASALGMHLAPVGINGEATNLSLPPPMGDIDGAAS